MKHLKLRLLILITFFFFVLGNSRDSGTSGYRYYTFG
ncbi:hypothetical protein AI2991V1_2752 [Klebsiella oxytoca]|nr:hypothetical protein AI2918V1_4052 [Klebsiella oxytoca]CAH5643988.1 hypothetical protein AI2991V1_2752 [Klebsiella oxytoca]CAH5909432.1 hypothetical protein AI2918V1_4052 [Klebsiella oxytoca]